MQEEVYNIFVEKLSNAMKDQLHAGDGFNDKTTQGPLINSRAVEKVMHTAFIQSTSIFIM